VEAGADNPASLGGLAGVDSASFEHIGSTSIAGLAAKPYLDRQVAVLPLPAHADLEQRLAPLGLERSTGSRPDSPGVDFDLPRGDVLVEDGVWVKRLYVAAAESIVLHVRRAESPWASYTIDCRDWLRAHPDERRRYADIKRRLSEDNMGKSDYDDYTRAKTTYFDEVQATFSAWAANR
jgi:dephospho-CoA kinase